MAAPMISSTIDEYKLWTSEVVFFFKTILELENDGQFCMAKSIQSLNDAIFKNYLKEARLGFPVR